MTSQVEWGNDELFYPAIMGVYEAQCHFYVRETLEAIRGRCFGDAFLNGRLASHFLLLLTRLAGEMIGIRRLRPEHEEVVRAAVRDAEDAIDGAVTQLRSLLLDRMANPN